MSEKLTIEDLLMSLEDPKSNEIENSKDLWARIGSGETWEDLGFDSQVAMEDWIIENEYSNI